MLSEDTVRYVHQYGEHNLSISDREIEMLLFLVRKWYTPNHSDIQIIEDCLYHLGGTIAEALIECIYNVTRRS